jgi:AraC family transcriptional regulator of adaptative response/methylated-DNA-[protein]-cysteine methyltransferase
VPAAATERGVCAVYLGDSEASLQSVLRGEYGSADIHHDAYAMRRWVEAILKYLSGVMPHLQLPLDVQGTAFQRIVWEELQRIPYGETRTYGQIAAALGRPKAARAVANACASNPPPLVIPCHRAVRNDGPLGGYRWGSFRKKALVECEKARELSSVRTPSPPPGRRG